MKLAYSLLPIAVYAINAALNSHVVSEIFNRCIPCVGNRYRETKPRRPQSPVINV